jgi:hypothetical protein
MVHAEERARPVAREHLDGIDVLLALVLQLEDPRSG